MKRKRSGQRGHTPAVSGFTLIEVMIAITLFGVALGLLLGGIRYTTRAWDAGERVGRESSDLQLAQRVLVDLAGHAFPLTRSGPAGTRYLFSGGPKRLRFAAFLPPYPGQGGLYLLELYIETTERGDQLWLKRRLFDPRTPPEAQLAGAEARLVAESGTPLRFGYAAGRQEEPPLSWRDHWDEGAAPPALIRLSSGDQDDGHWPELVVRPAIDMDGNCLSPALGGLCRWKLQ